MRIPLKLVHFKGGVFIPGTKGAIMQSTDGKPVAYLDTDSGTVVFATADEDEVPVESVARMRRIKSAK